MSGEYCRERRMERRIGFGGRGREKRRKRKREEIFKDSKKTPRSPERREKS